MASKGPKFGRRRKVKKLLSIFIFCLLLGCGASLHQAIQLGNVEDVKQLLTEKDTDIEEKNSEGATPLWAALEEGYLTDNCPRKEIVKILIDNGADVNAPCYWDSKYTCLLRAMDKDRSNEIAKLILSKGVKNIDAGVGVGDGTTALMDAAWGLEKTMVELLITHGADVNAKNGAEGVFEKNRGRTALMYPFIYIPSSRNCRDCLEITKLLISHGADIKAKDVTGRSALIYALESRLRLTMNQIVNIQYIDDAIKLLIANGADVNAKAEYGETPFFYALVLGKRDIIELMLSKGADVNAKTKYESWPLIVTLLGLDFWKKEFKDDRDNITKFQEIIQKVKNHDGEETAQIRIAKKVLLDTLKIEDFTRTEIIRLLLNKGAEVNAKDDYGRSALYYAIEKKDVEVVKLLRSKGAKILK